MEKSLGREENHTLGPWTHTRHKYRPLDVALTRLRLGTTRLKKDMHRYGLHDSPNCSNCDAGVQETRQHFFFDCDAYTQQRRDFFNTLNDLGIRTPSLELILGKSDLEEGVKRRVTLETANFILKCNKLEEI